MNAFRFKMQTILDLRQNELDDIQLEMAAEQEKRVQIAQRIAEYDHLIEKSLKEQAHHIAHNETNVTQAQQFPQYLLRLKLFRSEDTIRLQEQDVVLNAIKEKLTQAMIKVKGLEKLKEKDQQRHKKEMFRSEDLLISEMSLNQFRKRNAV